MHITSPLSIFNREEVAQKDSPPKELTHVPLASVESQSQGQRVRFSS
jgi:hypothetical protein